MAPIVRAYLQAPNATITSGTKLSTAIKVTEFVAGFIQFPAALTSTTFTLLGSVDNGTTFNAVCDSTGTALAAIACGASALVQLPDQIKGLDQIKIQTASNEGAARTLLIGLKG